MTFRVNSAVLSPQAKQQLDEFAAKVANAKAYTIEVAGHTDSTGGEAKNFRLSRQRADAVVQYLAVNHKIPLRRFVTPMGFGKTEAVADNTTATGRAQNRRVEVKMLLNRGMSQNTTTSTLSIGLWRRFARQMKQARSQPDRAGFSVTAELIRHSRPTRTSFRQDRLSSQVHTAIGNHIGLTQSPVMSRAKAFPSPIGRGLGRAYGLDRLS